MKHSFAFCEDPGFGLGSGGLSMSGGTLDLNGLPRVPLASLGGGGGSGGFIETSSGSSQLLFSPSGTSTSFESSIVNGGGLLSLLENGEGTLILSGTNTYSGGTIVSAGTLVAESSYSMPVGGSLTVGSGASLLFGPEGGSGSPVIPASVSSVPESGTAALLLAATFGLGLVVFRRRYLAWTAASNSSSRSDAMTVAVGFNPRTTVYPHRSVSRVATIENQPSLRDEE